MNFARSSLDELAEKAGMSVHFALPHLFQFGDPHDEGPAHLGEEPYGLEPDYDAPELYGEEEGIRVLYQQAFLERD